MTPPRTREVWVDNVKALACVLVVLGHFSQSMVKSGFVAEGALYGWFQATVYTFHVPLFFVCSGYLYQRFSRVDSAAGWWLNVRKKLLALGVPYFFFTLVTLAMKALAGDAVNDAAGGWLETLFLQPTAPYWYLYTLFFMFLVVPTAKDGRMCGCILAAALAGKAFMLLGGGSLGLPYCVSQTLSYLPWFAAGMCLQALGWRRLLTPAVGAVSLAFLPLSAAGYALGLFDYPLFGLLIGVLACVCVVSLVMWAFRSNAQNPAWGGVVALHDAHLPHAHHLRRGAAGAAREAGRGVRGAARGGRAGHQLRGAGARHDRDGAPASARLFGVPLPLRQAV